MERYASEVHSIVDLLNGGDWACAECEPEGLAGVCLELGRVLATPLAAQALHIARLTDVDMRRATGQWDELCQLVRHRHESLETTPRTPRPLTPLRPRNRPGA